MIGYRSANEKLEKESAELKERINKLQSKLSESKTNANVINNRDTTDNGIVSQLKEETEAAQHQVSKYEDFCFCIKDFKLPTAIFPCRSAKQMNYKLIY